ncbi:hypothetical protein [Succinimonas amylolytica]|uniref:hypothetical protein n=1 Tax=Succinimonas amylolytica TaxID=83769 RepID=UPI000364BA70|nr:hypothetical protein [Succinimonas amylolytica]
MSRSLYDKIKISLAKSRYIVPLRIIREGSAGEARENRFNETGSYDCVTSLLKSSRAWKQLRDNRELALRHSQGERKSRSFIDSDIYRHILNTVSLNCRDNPESISGYSIGSAWEYLPVAHEPPVIIWEGRNDSSTGPETAFRIVRAGLFVFRTGVALFWFETGAPGPEYRSPFRDPYALIQFQNCIKELSAKWLKTSFRQSSSDSSSHFIAGIWIAEILNTLLRNSGHEVSYYSSRNAAELEDNLPEGVTEVPDTAMIFTLTTMKAVHDYDFESVRKELSGLAFLLSNGFDLSYLLPEDTEQKSLRPFSNMVWTASAFGLGQCVVYNEKGRSFFENVLPDRMFFDYFMIYIIMLYQHYSVLYYSEQLELSIPSNPDSISLETLNSFSERINLFLVKSVYASVSYLEQHNLVYRYLGKTLRINDNIRDLTVGLDSLGKLIRNRRQDEDAEREKEIQGAINYLALLIIASALTDIYAVANENLPDLLENLRILYPDFWDGLHTLCPSLFSSDFSSEKQPEMWFMVKLGAFLLVVCYFVWFVLKFLKMKILNTSGNKEPESPEKQSRHRRFGQ